MMKAKQIVYEGLHFRSKLEARYYIFFKSLGFDIEYEPEVKNVYGYQPDFVIYTEREADDYLSLGLIHQILSLNRWKIILII